MNSFCLDCGSKYNDSLFLWISDALWSNIGCKSDDYLCSNCIIQRLLDNGYTYGFLIPYGPDHKEHDDYLVKHAGVRIIKEDVTSII